MKNRNLPLLIFTLTLSFFNVFAQESSDFDHKFENFKDLFTIYPNQKSVKKDSTLYPSKLIMAPIVGFSPETNLSMGIGAKYLFKFKGSGEETRTSNMPMTIQYTLKNQFILFSGFEIFTNKEKWVMIGNFAFKNFPRLFYGFGRNSTLENEEEYDSFQLRFEPRLLKQMFMKHLFVGGGIRYNHIFGSQIKDNGILSNTKPSGYKGSTSTGVELGILYDSRDNILNARSGLFVELTHGFYGKALGGTQNFQLSRFDIRYFFKPFKKSDGIIGLHAIGRFTFNDVPFSELSLFGSEEILRGYIEGRYIDNHIIAAQAEYRKHLFGRLGMAVFAGFGDVANKPSNFRFKNLRPSVGVGLRFLLDKEEQLNARFDFGVGQQSSNPYLGISEAF